MVQDSRMNLFRTDLVSMARAVMDSMHQALDSLKNSDRALALKVIENDEAINHFDRTINNFAIETIMLQQPVARDLRLLVGGIKVATDLERIGDYSKNICRYVIMDTGHSKEDSKMVATITNVFLSNFDYVIKALDALDDKAAHEAATLDAKLDNAFKDVISVFEGDSQRTLNIHLINVLRNIERAGDHSKNICEQIIYIVKGEHIDFG